MFFESHAVSKPRRIRDPVHDLIEFDTDELDQTAWKALNSPEFQRLRRIRQLGFSELVFPGATHSRFAHSVGVYHTAKKLARLIETRVGEFDRDRSNVAVLAALVHDLGHGPFSHAFEEASKALGIKKEHEDWTAEIVVGDTEVAKVLAEIGDNVPGDVARLVASETPTDIYSAIVSSQFDADRLDYVRRDRLMAGVQHGGFDFPWLMANLEVDRIAISQENDQFGEVDSLILGNKALQAAEAYVLGLFHLYFTLYFHKATRSAEKMLSAILQRVGELIKADQFDGTGLTTRDPICHFLQDPSLANYLKLDDFGLWSSLQAMANAPDPTLAELGSRLLNRRLFKAVNVTSRVTRAGSDAGVAQFRARLKRAREQGEIQRFDVLDDQATRNPYQRRGFDSPDALKKVLIRRPDGKGYQDLAERSEVVKSLQQQSIFHVYVRNESAMQKVEDILGGITA